MGKLLLTLVLFVSVNFVYADEYCIFTPKENMGDFYTYHHYEKDKNSSIIIISSKLTVNISKLEIIFHNASVYTQDKKNFATTFTDEINVPFQKNDRILFGDGSETLAPEVLKKLKRIVQENAKAKQKNK